MIYYYLFTSDGRLFHTECSSDPSRFLDMVTLADRYGLTLTWGSGPVDTTKMEHSGE
jgi:hypothetical protein